MKIESVKFVYFSPTGTTESVVHGIAEGINHSTVEIFDITKPEARNQPLITSGSELLVVAVPVYMGRVPALINNWLNSIKANNTPSLCVVVYGNRAYENALIELKDIIVRCGCIPIAGWAFIGEHSFSDSETPSKGRPDENDLNHAKTFGLKIGEKLQSISSMENISDINVPGTHTYGGVTKLWDVDFIEVSNNCTQCGVCTVACPSGAIYIQDSKIINIEKCLTCCACIKGCPENARTMKPGPVKDAQGRVNTLFTAPKKPEYFL